MAKFTDLTTIWTNIREVDLRPLRDEALLSLKIALVGAPGSGRHTLAAEMRCDPARPDMRTQSPVGIYTLEEAQAVSNPELIILMIDSAQSDTSQEQGLALRWNNAGKRVVVFVNVREGETEVDHHALGWPAESVLIGSAMDDSFLRRRFVPVVMNLLPNRHLALGRQFPLFRVPIAHDLINDTCMSNTAYAISTGLAEIVPVLDLPLNITDMIVLTKSQAFLVYKLGLVFGFSTQWRDYIAEFGSVIGGGFLWRQLARQLIGLIPVWGIVPKVAVAYAGTYVVGTVILQWYLTGRHLSSSQMKALYLQAFTRGKEFAKQVGSKMPKPRLGRRKRGELPMPASMPELPASEATSEAASASELSVPTGSPEMAFPEGSSEPIIPPPAEDASPSKRRFGWGKKEKTPKGEIKAKRTPKPARRHPGRQKETLPATPEGKVCAQCSKTSARDAIFCQYCGSSFDTLEKSQ
jgi:uncharacterized protein (DUF697 family)